MPEARERTHYVGDGCTPPHDAASSPLGGWTGARYCQATGCTEPASERIEGLDGATMDVCTGHAEMARRPMPPTPSPLRYVCCRHCTHGELGGQLGHATRCQQCVAECAHAEVETEAGPVEWSGNQRVYPILVTCHGCDATTTTIVRVDGRWE